MNGNFDWVPIYKDIAKKILEYKNDRVALIKMMYEILEAIGRFDDADEENCNFDSVNGKRQKYDDFDAFSFMNRLACYGHDTIKKFIKLFEQKTNMEIKIPSGFDGLPSVSRFRTCMIRHKDQREDGDIDKLWTLFEIAIKYADDQSETNKISFVENYNIVRELPLCKYCISCCLFRLNPDFYISLDENSRAYIKENYNIEINDCPNGEEYLRILETMKRKLKENNEINSFYKLSYIAWLNRNKKQKRNNAKKVWILACGENGKMWDTFKDTNTISIGWNNLGDLSDINSGEIKDLLDNCYPSENDGSRKNDRLAIDNFVNNMNVGDTVIIKKGLKKLLAYGTVTSDYYYDEDAECKHKREVNWERINEVSIPEDEKLVMKTLTDVTTIPTSDKRYKYYYERLINLIDGGDNVDKVKNIRNDIKYYVLVTNQSEFSFRNCEIGHEEEFIKTKLNTCFEDVQIGDKIICYEAHPKKIIVALCEISQELDDNNTIKVKKVAEIENGIRYEELKKYKITSNIDNRITLFEINKSTYNNIIEEIKKRNPLKIGYNKIYYGVPGCGKSHKVQKDVVNEINYIRTTFYPDYSYSDFVGQIIPETDLNGNIRYDFNSGPFVQALEYALENDFINYYLIIEELNRGNAAAIFGDIFQLLDRGKSGKSEMPIINKMISKHLKHSTNEITIPSNLTIIGTMNTSDQNVYTLDTAFKRRWEMERVKNVNTSKDYDNLYVPGSKHKWNQFYELVNKKIRDKENELNYNSEDKELGAYFAEKSILSIKKNDDNEELINKFAHKVLFYIWDDVVKFERSIWFGTDIKSFDDLCDEFKEKHLAIFKNIDEFNDDSELNDKNKK